MRNPGKFTLIALLAGAIFSVLISIYAFDFNAEEAVGVNIIMFILMETFVLLPYTLLYLLWWRTFRRKGSWGQRMVLFFTAVIMVLFHIYAYTDALFSFIIFHSGFGVFLCPVLFHRRHHRSVLCFQLGFG